MPKRLDELEEKIERLLRYVELLETNLQDIKERIETRTGIDKVEGLVLKLAESFKCRKDHDN